MRKECNGLYLCEVPTGIGKSYQAAHAMEEYAKAMRQCARTITDERKLIYLTPLRKNVGEEEEELKKAYENEELFEKEVLHIKSNVDNIIENLGKVTIPQDKQPFNYDELKKQVKAYNGESSPEIKKIWEDKVEEEERKFRKEIKNTLSVIPARERLERIKNDKQYQWIGQLYPVVFIKEKKIILMTISKFLSKNISLVDKSITFFDSDISKNAVIFMDEFDSTKEFVRNHIIQNSFKSNDDYLDVFRQIASNMDLTNFDRYVTEAETRIDEDGTKYEKFCDRAKKIMEDYKLNLNYKTVLEQDDIKQPFIFHDGQINTICKKGFSVVGIENMVKNRIDIQQVDEKEEINGAISISALLKDIHDFLRDFRFFLLKWAEQYATVVNIYRQKTETPMDILQEDNALSSLMGCFKLKVDQQKLVYDEADKIKIELKSKKEDFYQTGFEYYRFVDADRHKGENDLHDEIFNKCIVQHITVENYKKCDLEKNPEFYAIIQELFIKEDIVNKQLTMFNWSETLGKSGKTWAFVSFKKDDTDKNTKKKDQYTYYRVFIAPDGKLSFDSCAGRSWMRRKDEWKNIIGYHQELIDKRKSEKRYDENIEGFFYTDINDICTICKTNVCVYPRFDDIEAELLLLKADKELDKEQMIDALLHFKEDSPELVKKNKEDFEQVLNNLKNKEEEYVDKKFFYKKILKKGKLREGFNEYLRTEYRILLNLSKSKENLPLYDLDAMTDIHYSVSSDSDGELIKYFVGSAKALNRSVARSNPIRKIIGKTLKAEEILPMLTATFVRNEQYTVIPFPYKYIREYFQIS